jgi:hypothetical protein
MIKWIIIFIVLINQTGFAQSAKLKKNFPDSTDFWINTDYYKCITLGNDVCECLSKNEFVMLYLDYEKEKVLIQSSTYYFGLETTVYLDMKEVGDEKLVYTVAKQWPLSDSLVIVILDNKLTVGYKNDKIIFNRQILKTLDVPTTPKGIFSYDMEIWMQRNVLNSKSLLAFPYTDKKPQLFSIDELKKLIENKKVTISCSDDFHYNSMWIKQDTIRYFQLEYRDNNVTIYELPKGRNRFENIKLEGLKKQEFYKEKQK